MRYLAIDLGAKRTGLAIGDDQTRIATPLNVIVTSNSSERLRQIGQIIHNQGPDALILGLPLNMDGTAGKAAETMRQFRRQLEEKFNLPVHEVDERLTSYAADQLMAQSELTHKQKKLRRDALAAMTLLQNFFHANRLPSQQKADDEGEK